MPICELCKHYIPGLDPRNDRGQPICAAFPGQIIPSEILNGGYDHRKPLYNEDILFELSDEYGQPDLDDWERQDLEIRKADMLAVLDQLHAFENEENM
jgi:hypothetical protein